MASGWRTRSAAKRSKRHAAWGDTSVPVSGTWTPLQRPRESRIQSAGAYNTRGRYPLVYLLSDYR